MRRKLKIIKMGTKKGFSLAEVMLSVFVLSIGLVATIALMSQNIHRSIDGRNEIIASQLAQEGVELVRNKRDTNIAKVAVGDPITKEVAFAGISAGTYCPEMNYSGTENVKMTLCNGSSSRKLYIGSSGYTYSSTGGSETLYSRRVVITGASTSNERTIESMVIWGGTSFPSSTGVCNISNKCAVVQVTINDSSWR